MSDSVGGFLIWKSFFSKIFIPKNLASVIAAICFAMIGHGNVTVYNIAHWATTRDLVNLELKLRSIDFAFTEIVSQDKQKQELSLELQKTKKEIQGCIKRLREQRCEIMSISSIYHICGLLSMIFAVWALITGPIIFGLIAVPFGLYGLFLFVVVI